MTQWQLDPATISSVLVSAGDQQQTLAGALAEEKFTAIFECLESGMPFTSAVPDAVSRLLADQQQNLQTIGNRVGAGITGVFNATRSYQNGQEEMAGEFATRIDDAADGDFSFFEAHGYRGE